MSVKQKAGDVDGDRPLSAFHEAADLVVIADQPEGDLVGELEDDPIV